MDQQPSIINGEINICPTVDCQINEFQIVGIVGDSSYLHPGSGDWVDGFVYQGLVLPALDVVSMKAARHSRLVRVAGCARQGRGAPNVFQGVLVGLDYLEWWLILTITETTLRLAIPRVWLLAATIPVAPATVSGLATALGLIELQRAEF